MYLGIDVGSQSIKAVLLQENLSPVTSSTVDYVKELPEYKTVDGFHVNGNRVTSPPGMWIEALDQVVRKLSQLHSLKSVRAVSVSGQQHGSVYWRSGCESVLQRLVPTDVSLRRQVLPALFLPYSPVWRDSSTQPEVDQIVSWFGGDKTTFERTGSRGTLRFTGSQILKVRKEVNNFDDQCERVSLVSSFITSLLLGSVAAIDTSDGSGMNLLNLQTLEWDEVASKVCDMSKLGRAVSAKECLGSTSKYWEKYGLNCVVVAGSGDNNNALVGARIQPEDIAISLGTSDTVMQTMNRMMPSTYYGHVFAHPLFERKFMSLLCVTNGALARRAVCEKHCGGDWDKFSAALGRTEAGNQGYIGLYYFTPETVPAGGRGVWRGRVGPGQTIQPGASFPDGDTEVRAIVESQMLSLRLHSHLDSAPGRIIVTGGGSSSKAICQVIADVFGCDVYVGKDTGGNAAAFGAAIRARVGLEGLCEEGVRKLFSQHPSDNVLVAKPDAPNHARYTSMMTALKDAIAQCVANPSATVSKL